MAGRTSSDTSTGQPRAAGKADSSSPLGSRGEFLQGWSWEAVIGLNRSVCARSGGQHGFNNETQNACAVEWQNQQSQTATLDETLEFLRHCERSSPFLFFNGPTFEEVARSVATYVFSAFPVTRRRHLISAIGDYVAGVLDRGAMVEIVESLSKAQQYAEGDRIKTLRGRTTGKVVKIMPDGRVKWRADDSEADMFSLPETLLRTRAP